MTTGLDLETAIKELSPENLEIYKRQLTLKVKSLQPEQREAVFTRLKGIPELSDIVGSAQPEEPITKYVYSPQPQDEQWSLWAGVESAFAPLSMAGMGARKLFHPGEWGKVSVPGGFIRVPFLSQREPEEKDLSFWSAEPYLPGGSQHEKYSQLPMWQQLAWESPAMLLGGGVTATGIRGALAKTAAKGGAKGAVSQAARAGLKPAELVETGISKAIEYPLKGAAKGVSKILSKGVIADLQPFDEVVKVASKPDVTRKLANLPGMSFLSRLGGGLAAVAKKPAEWARVGRAMLRAEGQAKTSGVIANLERLGSSKTLFRLTRDGIISEGPLKGMHLNTIRTYPERYASQLTHAQREWIEQAAKIESAKLKFLKRNGIEIRELSFDEGGRYAGRRVYAKVTPEGELLDAGFVGAGPGRPGSKTAFEKTRRFASADEAIKAGYRYLPEEEALALNVQAAYNRVADKMMADWLLAKIPWRPAVTRVGEETKLINAINKALRGERVSESTILGIEKLFPDIGIRDAISTGDRATLAKLKNVARKVKKTRIAEAKLDPESAVRADIARRGAYAEAQVPIPAFQGKILTGSEARETARILMQEVNPQFSQALAAVNKVNSIGRYFALAGDMSPMTIQLIFMAGANPKLYGKALAGFIRAMFDPKFHAKYLANHAATIQASRNLLLAKGGTTEFTEAMARGGLLRKGPFKMAGKVLEPFQRGFETSLDVAGIELREAYSHLCTTPARAAEVEAFINEFRGLANTARLGVPLSQRQAETAAILAPKYNRAIVALLADVFKGGVRGSLARQSLAKGVTAISAMTVAVSLALGEDYEDIVEHLNPGSPRFMTWRIAGQNVGPGSKVRSVARLFAQSVTNPDDLIKLSMENPTLRFVRGNLSPVLGTGIDLLTGRNYIGDPTRDNLLQLTKTVVAENLTPIWVQSVAYESGDVGERLVRGSAEFLGMRGYPMTPYEKRDELRDKLAQEKYGMTWDDLASPVGPGRVAQIKIEQESVELQEATREAQEAWERIESEESKVWTAWRKGGESIEQLYHQDIQVAAKEFEATGDGVTFREKVNNSNLVRRKMYAEREKKPEYSEIYQYFNEPLDASTLAKMNPKDVARREYYQMMYSPDMYDLFGNYKFDEADRREAQFVQKYGQGYLDYIQEYAGAKWEGPQALKTLRQAQDLLQPYWEVEDREWGKYPVDVRQLSKQIALLEKTDPQQAKLLLFRHPYGRAVLYARKLIAMYRKQMKLRNPEIASALALFYRY